MNDDVIGIIKSYAGITPLDIANAYWKWYPSLNTLKNTQFKIKQIYLLIQHIELLYTPCNINSCTVVSERKYIQLYNLSKYIDLFSIAIAFYLCGYKLEIYQCYKNPLQCSILNCSRNYSFNLSKIL
jgi:hypothetical protein